MDGLKGWFGLLGYLTPVVAIIVYALSGAFEWTDSNWNIIVNLIVFILGFVVSLIVAVFAPLIYLSGCVFYIYKPRFSDTCSLDGFAEIFLIYGWLALPVGFVLEWLISGDIPTFYRIYAALTRSPDRLSAEIKRSSSDVREHPVDVSSLNEIVDREQHRFSTMLDTELIKKEISKVRERTAELERKEKDIRAIRERQAAASELAQEIKKMELLKARLDELSKRS